MAGKKQNSQVKATVKKRSLNANGGKANDEAGSPFNDADIKRRLGNYGGAGEHPLIGGRNTGIVGREKKKRFASKGKGKG